LEVINDTNQYKELFNLITGSLLTTFSVMLFVFLWKQGNIVVLNDNQLSIFFIMNSATQLAYYFFSSNLPRIYAQKNQELAVKSIKKNLSIFIVIFFIGHIFLYFIYPFILNFKISSITFFGYLISLFSLRFVQICMTQLREYGYIFYLQIGIMFFIINLLCWYIFYLYNIEIESLNFIIYFTTVQLLALIFMVAKYRISAKISKLYMLIIFSNVILLSA